MFRRLVFENSAALFTIVAFVTAASIYVTFAWRALRMKRGQVAHFENLPFDIETPESAPAGQNIIAQANALGNRSPQQTGALKGRAVHHVGPFQRSSSTVEGSQAGVLSCHCLPVQGTKSSA
jgi:hypothetical protein